MNEEQLKIRLVTALLSRADLKKIAAERFGDMVKAVVDVKRGTMAIGGELHADEEAYLLERDSQQEDIWGINLYPDEIGEGFIEYDSMINIRPSRGNRSRDIVDKGIREKIRDIVDRLIG